LRAVHRKTCGRIPVAPHALRASRGLDDAIATARRNAVTRSHVFDSHLEIAGAWLAEVAERLALAADEHPRALRALRAGLHAIRDRLPAQEVLDLGAQLPTLIRGIYYEGWRLDNDPASIRTKVAMVERVAKELAPDLRVNPVDVLRTVIQILVEHVSRGEIDDVLATLPRPISELWHELAGHALDDTPPPRSDTLTRRTGYSR
jgi:uncharacterized protein (DUF2267 family)